MNQGLINRYKKQIEVLKLYLKEHQDEMSEGEVNEALDDLGSLIEMLQILEGS